MKEKIKLNTLWNPTIENWQMALNQIPHNAIQSRKVINFVDRHHNSIRLNDFENIKSVLHDLKVFKKIKEDKDFDHNATLTHGKPAYLNGYLSSQLLTFITYFSAGTALVLLYLRSIEFPPYNATQVQTEEYQNNSITFFNYTLAAGLIGATFSWLTSTINKAHTDTATVEKEQYNYICEILDRLEQVSEEIKIKNETIKNINEFLKNDTPKFDFKKTLSLPIRPPEQQGFFGKVLKATKDISHKEPF